MTSGDTGRTSIIAGLREVADFLEAYPELPVLHHYTLLTHTAASVSTPRGDDADGIAVVDAAAEVLGVKPTGTTHYRAERRFGGVTYEVLHITSAHMAEYRARTSYQGNIQVSEGGGAS